VKWTEYTTRLCEYHICSEWSLPCEYQCIPCTILCII